MTVGKPIAAGEVLSKTVSLMMGNPVLLLPQVIALVLALLGTTLLGASFSLIGLGLIVYIVYGIVAIIVSGAYPTIVKAVVEGGRFSIADAMGRAYHKFWTLLGAGLLVGLIVSLGTVALVVPGLIFATWWAYTIPAIMLEDKGALEGMAASKEFGHDKKWSTFLIFLAVFAVAAVVGILEGVLTYATSPLVGQVIGQILFVPISAWVSVIASYTYITYGPSSVSAAMGTPAYGTMPSAPSQPGMQAGASPARFCSACGAPLPPGSRFCSNCGKAVS